MPRLAFVVVGIPRQKNIFVSGLDNVLLSLYNDTTNKEKPPQNQLRLSEVETIRESPKDGKRTQNKKTISHKKKGQNNMSKNYFENVTTAEELKKTFHQWVKKLHPDNGGDPEAFKEMKSQWEKLSHSNIWNTHKTAEGKTYEKENTTTPEQFTDIIEKLRSLEKITIEILGSWIWVTGDTRNYKEILKELGFLFSSKKQAWYFNGETKKRRTHSKMNYSDLQKHWGVSYSETTGEKVKIDKQPALLPA